MKIFRSHTTVPDGIISPLYRQLTHEWVDLHHSPATTSTLRRWARSEPTLNALHTPGQIVDHIDAAPNAEKDLILLALLRLAHDGHQLAGRTLLQALLPKLARIARSTTAKDLATGTRIEDRRHTTIAEFWDVMSTYPTRRRTRSVAANLTLDTLHRVSHAGQQPEPIPVSPHDQETTDDFDALGYRDTTQARRAYLDNAKHSAAEIADPQLELTSDVDLTQLLQWGRGRGVITTDEADLLSTVYLHADRPGQGYATAVKHTGCAQAALRQRCSRAVRKLTAAVQEEMCPHNQDVAVA